MQNIKSVFHIPAGKNKLILSYLRFLCDYELEWYPFDIQKCLLILQVTKSASPQMRLISKELKYLGKKYLTQYEVMKTTMETKSIDDAQQLVLEITLGRQLLGTVLNIFIPTIVLNIISYTTNFYKDDFFETVVAINLTTMLVIVTLFVSVSENLPATSYMKMMDIWLLFNLLVPFNLILIHTYMENLRGYVYVNSGKKYGQYGQFPSVCCYF